MNKRFKDKYGVYDGVSTNTFKHIPEVSSYNHNYYIGLSRDGGTTFDLLFARGDDDNLVDWYIINGSFVTYIGYEFSDKGVINLSDV